jgi:transcriptional regulator with XRE-family HTH domain
MPKLTKVFANRLAHLLKGRGKMAALGRKGGFSNSQIIGYKQGVSPTLDQLERIAAALETTPADLITDRDAPTDPLRDEAHALVEQIAREDLLSLISSLRSFAARAR